MLASRIKQMMHQSPWWSVWALLMLLSSLWLALYLHQFIDYGFGAWYQLLDIYQHIQTFAPQNYYKSGFAQLSDQDYTDLFGQISWAINHGGETLASISYTVKGETILLLRPPEVVHLQDVAQLIERVNRLGIVMVIASSVLTIFLLYRRIPLSWWAVCGQLLCVIAVVTAALFIIGPKEVFYWFHIVLFPSDNQWFFYYQESLMTTLMKAPDLFAGISATIGGFAMLLLALIFTAFSYWLKRN